MTWLGNSVRTMEQEINEFGTYKGRPANMGSMLCRRTDGWTSTSVQGDLCNYLDTSQAQANTPSIATQYYLHSTSAQDGVAGTGIQSVVVNYLDAAGARVVATVVMNGVTPVALPFFVTHIQYIESSAVGTGGVAAGNITIGSNAAGSPTVAQTIAKILAGDGRSMDGILQVPLGYSCYLLSWGVRAIGNRMDTRLRATVFTNDHSLSPGYHFEANMYLPDGAAVTEDLHYFKLPALAKIKISAIPGAVAAGNRCDGTFTFCLVSDT